MGRVFIVELGEDCRKYYFCKTKNCITTIADARDSIKDIHTDTEFTGSIFAKVVNVVVEEDPNKHRLVGAIKVADVYCVQCCNRLGYKYVEVPLEQQTVEVQENRVKLIGSKLMMYDVDDNHMYRWDRTWLPPGTVS